MNRTKLKVVFLLNGNAVTAKYYGSGRENRAQLINRVRVKLSGRYFSARLFGAWCIYSDVANSEPVAKFDDKDAAVMFMALKENQL